MIIIIGMCSSVNATNLKTNLDVIQQASETKYLETDQGYISKSIVDSNKDTGEVTIELKLSNTKKDEKIKEETEVFFIVYEQSSFSEEGQSRINYSKKMVEKVLNSNAKVKFGIIGVKGPTTSGTNGSANDSEILLEPTNNYETFEKGMDNLNPKKENYFFNYESAMYLAQSCFSKDKNKVLISLIDGISQTGIGIDNVAYSPVADLKEKSDAMRKQILKLKNLGIDLIVLRKENQKYIYTYGTNTKIDANEYIDAMYGTIDNPICKKIYLINETTSIEKIINENILKDINNYSQKDINTVKIVDYFPQDITENFVFSYVENASLGTKSETIDAKGKTITWDIGTLKGQEVATLRYKLKIKDMKNATLLNKTISTNEKVVLTYKDANAKDYTVTLSSSPKIQLSEVKEELNATVSYEPTTKTTGIVKATIKTNKKVNAVDGWTLSDDGMILTKTYSTNITETVHLVDIDNMTKDVVVTISNITKTTNPSNDGNKKEDTTVATGKLPQTGVSMIISFVIISTIAIAVIFYKKYSNYKDIK